MRAIRIGEKTSGNGLLMGSVAPRDPGPDEISVRIRASSINYHDYFVVTTVRPEGRIPLSDGAGEVVAVGDRVTEFKIGDSVVSTFFPDWLDGEYRHLGFGSVPGDGVDGFACEQVTRPATAFTLSPIGYTFEEAATLTCAGTTAWRALIAQGGVKPGEVVLVLGSGGVSTFALKFAKAAGAVVIAISSSDDKLERLKALGADHGINYRARPNWGEAAGELTGGGVDHVIEIGGAGTLEQSIAACRPGGHIALIGVLAGHEGPVPTAMIMIKQQRLIGLTVGSRRHQMEMVRAINSNDIRPHIDRRFPLSELAEAFRYQETGSHFGKICISV